MPTTARGRSTKAGLPPGTAVHIGQRKLESPRLRWMNFDATLLNEKELMADQADAAQKAVSGITWVHVTGVHDVKLLERLGRAFGLHPLVVEDISNTDQRPKLEDYSDFLYVVLKLVHSEPGVAGVKSEQVSIVLGPDFVLSFEESDPTVFDSVRERLRDNRTPIRSLGADYLAYSLMDSAVDSYFSVLEQFGDRVEQLQDDLTKKTSARTQQALHQLRRDMVRLRKSIWPAREVIGTFERGASALVRRETWIYIRDVYDHVIHIIESLESQNEILAYSMDLYLLNATNRLNEIIKVLTVFATLSIPPMLIASIYGMNFRHMPELAWPWGYPLALGVMGGLVLAMLLFFRRKKWF